MPFSNHMPFVKTISRYAPENTFREKEANDLFDDMIVVIFAKLARFCKERVCTTKEGTTNLQRRFNLFV